MSTKVCPGCPENGEQPLENFYKSRTAKDGRQVRCKSCQLKYQAENRERAKERSADWRRKHGVPKKRRAHSSKGGPGTLFPKEQ